MSSRNEQQRERLKQEYKEHYKRIKEAKERLKQAERTSKIQGALNKMSPDNLMESMDEFLGKVQDKVIGVEARLDVAMDSLDDSSNPDSVSSKEEQIEQEEELRKIKAQEALKQMKIEMGMLYSEIEKTADEIKAHKTIGTKEDNSEEPDKTEE